jgi:enamine deaminase RidA (YjgF/YER057c/UK114 family)
MAGAIEARLSELGLELPVAAAPAANYVPFVRTGDQIFISGQIPMKDGAIHHQGQLGADTSVEDGQAAARLCALNLIAQMKAACDGDLDRVARVVKLVGFVNSAAGFGDQPKVVNGASDLMVEVFGDKGRHARSAVGVAGLPFGVAVEVEAVIEVA